MRQTPTLQTPVPLIAKRLAANGQKWPEGWHGWANVRDAFIGMLADAKQNTPPQPSGQRGRGIVIPAGGWRFFLSLYVTVRAIRQVGCSLPIQVWYLGDRKEFDPRMQAALEPFSVGWIDAQAYAREHNIQRRIWGGWELKPFAACHAPFSQVLLLDADSYPVQDPELFLDRQDVVDAGAVFWPDMNPLEPGQWQRFGLDLSDLPSFESGQLYVDKDKHWAALWLADWLNQHSDYVYKHIHGDKDTFHIGWQAAGHKYLMHWPKPGWNQIAFVQYDHARKPLFVHRTRDKFRFATGEIDGAPVDGICKYMTGQSSTNAYVPSLPLEDFCHAAAREGDVLMRPADGRGNVGQISTAAGQLATARRSRRRVAAMLLHHRSASTWARLLFGRLAGRLGLSGQAVDTSIGTDQQQLELALDTKAVVFDGNATQMAVDTLAQYDFKAIHITRDPRDVVVSSYWAYLGPHPNTIPGLAALKTELAQVPIEEGLVATIKFLGWMWSDLCSIGDNSNVWVVPYGQAVGSPGFVSEAAKWLGWSVDEKLATEIRDEFTFKQLSGRKRGKERRKHHYRKGVVGGWRKYWSPAVDAAMQEAAGDLVERFGE